MRIDGSHGEGGGQILRTAVTLSCITQKPVQIENIRKNRKNPGLRPQHLTAIKLVGKVCNGKVEGLKIGSSSIKFIPNSVENSELYENIGTAASLSLILQVLIPVVSISRKKLKLTIIGGTDVPWSPTGNYTKFVLSEAYSRFGIKFLMNIQKRGYYPKGGGTVNVSVFPRKKLTPINLLERKTKNAKLICSFSKLSLDEIKKNVGKIQQSLEQVGFKILSEIIEEPALDKGAALTVFSRDSNSVVGIDSLMNFQTGSFDSKIPNKFLEQNLGVDEHLADMIVVPASLVNELSIFRVKRLSKHLKTNLYVTSKITGCKYGIGKIDGGFEVRISGNSNSCI